MIINNGKGQTLSSSQQEQLIEILSSMSELLTQGSSKHGGALGASDGILQSGFVQIVLLIQVVQILVSNILRHGGESLRLIRKLLRIDD